MTSDSIKNRRLIGLFLLGCVLFNHPLLSLFNLDRVFLGIPLFYLYIFAVWSGIIVLLILVTQPTLPHGRRPAKPQPDAETGR